MEDKVTPRYLKEETCSKDEPSKVSGGRQCKETLLTRGRSDIGRKPEEE